MSFLTGVWKSVVRVFSILGTLRRSDLWFQKKRWRFLFMYAWLDYCNVLYTCLNKSSMDRLQVVQNAAARLWTRTTRRLHITPVLKALHWLPIGFRVHLKILIITYRALHGQAPSYIHYLLHAHSPGQSLRSSDMDLLTIPTTRLKTRGDRAFCVVSWLWSSLPLSLRTRF